MRIQRTVCCAALLTLVPSVVSAQQQAQGTARMARQVAAAADSFRQREHVPALAVAAIRQGRTLIDTAFGLADLEDSARATRHTRFRVGSISKAIAAAAVLHAVDQGLVSLTTEIQAYVPAYPRKRYPVLVEQLLRGTSGVRGYRGDEYRRFEQFPSLAASLQLFATDSLAYVPGTNYMETPYGFTLLGLALEAQTQTPYAQYVYEAVLQPAGMRATSPDHWASVLKDRAKPYTLDSLGHIRNAEPIDVSYKTPSGGWIATAGDIARFGEALMQSSLFTRTSHDTMMAPVRLTNGKVLPLGMGTALGTAGGRLPGDEEAVWGSGLIQGGTAVLLMYPKSDLAVAILTNVNGELGLQAYNYLMRVSQLAIRIGRQYR